MGRPFILPQRHTHLHSLGYRPAPHIEGYRSRFLDQVVHASPAPPQTFLEHLAVCQVWTGAIDRRNGMGFARFAGREVPVQAYAYELYYAPICEWDVSQLLAGPQKMVARCVAAKTKNCVHEDHLGTVRARTTWFFPITLEERQLIRQQYEEDGRVEWVTGRGRLPLARVARIILRLEGDSD